MNWVFEAFSHAQLRGRGIWNALYQQRPFSKTAISIGIILLLSGSYIAITGSTVEMATVQWDEFTDLVIASHLSQHPLGGSSWDGSQARLPMYVTAIAYRITQTINPNFELLDLLPVSRWFSIFMTTLAICGTFILANRLFDATIGVLAAALFTFSPFVLHFGQAALTQGDAFTPATVVFTIIAFEQFTSKRTTFWLVCFSFCLALAIASKFFLAVLIPALMTFHLVLETSKRCEASASMPATNLINKKGFAWRYVFLASSTGLLALLAVIAAFQRIDQPPETYQFITLGARLIWATTLFSIFICFWLAIKDVRVQATKPGQTLVFWRLDMAWLVILPLTFAIVLALFPAHIFNPSILSTLFDRFITLDGNSNLSATSFDSIKLYSGLLLLKLGLPLGIVTYMTLAWAIRQSWHNRQFLLMTLILLYYGALLLVLPLQQPFWLMSIYPLIMIILSVGIVQNVTRLKTPNLRFIGASYMIFAFSWLIIGLFQVYPTFGYYGYELVGDQWLGNNSRGHRALVVVTNDGSTEAIDWLRQNVTAESAVVTYLDDPHIINYLKSNQPFVFELNQVQQYQDQEEIDEALAKADFVVIRVIGDTSLLSPIYHPDFGQQFGTKPVHQILRGRGIYQMPVIQIYQRISEANIGK